MLRWLSGSTGGTRRAKQKSLCDVRGARRPYEVAQVAKPHNRLPAFILLGFGFVNAPITRERRGVLLFSEAFGAVGEIGGNRRSEPAAVGRAEIRRAKGPGHLDGPPDHPLRPGYLQAHGHGPRG